MELSYKHVSAELKNKILSELDEPGKVISAVAKKYGLTAKRLYQWRTKLRKSVSV